MRKAAGFALVGLALAACEPAVPNSAAGVGFGDYQSYLHQRDAELKGGKPVTTPPLPAAPMGQMAGQTAGGSNAAALDAAAAAAPKGTIGADALAALAATAPAPATPAPAALPVAGPGNGARVGAPLDAIGVGGTRPAPVTDATVAGSAGPNLAAYALSATNPPGQSVFARGGLRMTSTKKACGKYVSPDLAQMAFLENGGPVRDPGNLDPDGDGFACGWDPRPFQAARK